MAIIAQLFSEFLKSFIKKNKDNKNYLNYYEQLKTVTPTYNINKCDFLDSSRINVIIEKHFKNTTELYFKKYKETNNHEEASKYQFDTFVKNIDLLKIHSFINSNIDTKYIISKIESTIGKTINNITLADLRTFVQLIYTNYFETILITFVQDFFVDRSVIDEKTKILKKWTKYHSAFFDNSEYDASQSFYPQSYLTYNKTFGFKKDDLGKSLKMGEQSIDLEQSDIFNYPNIQIFCSSLNKVEEIIPFIFNRFIFLHEFGHNICFENNSTIKIKGNNYDLKNSTGKWEYNELIYKDIENLMTDSEKRYAEKYKLTNIYKSASSFKILDIGADYLAISTIVKELNKLKIEDKKILEIIANIMKQLHGDDYHFDAKIRFYLNIYMNPFLLSVYDSNVSQGEPDTDLDVIDMIKVIKTKIESIDISKYPELMPTLNLVLTQSVMIPTLETQRKIIKFYYDNNIEWYMKNIDKINKFFDDISMSLMDDDENNYMKKYLKYKQKYLQLKKLKN
jgi:hypothetical protein